MKKLNKQIDISKAKNYKEMDNVMEPRKSNCRVGSVKQIKA